MLNSAAVVLILILNVSNFELSKATEYWDTCDCYQKKDCDCANEEILRFKREGTSVYQLT